MPFVPPLMTTLMIAKGASSGMTGQYFSSIVSATSSAVCLYIPASAVVMSTNVVMGPGAGTYFGKIVGCVPSAMSVLMMAKAAAFGLVGRDTKKLFDAISFGVCQTLLTTAISQGTVIGGGPGVGQGKIINLVPTALQSLILANMASKTLVGTKTMQILSAIAFGICTHIMSACIVTTTCIGVFSPPPAGPIVIPTAPGPGRIM